jgi:sugar O-acyltransferase (sialic acid O-acetyltransferase NeuD family)
MTTRNLIIIGAGKFAREVHTWVRQAIDGGLAWTIKGFLDDNLKAMDGFGHYPKIICPVDQYEPQADDIFLCAMGKPKIKKLYCDKVAGKGGKFETFIHPTALVGPSVQIGAGSILCPYTQLSCDIVLGECVTFGTLSNTAHDTRIGAYSMICGSCEINGNAVLEEGVFLGSHATILPDARVGAWAYVGAGSVVLRRVKPGTKVFGNPAVPIGAVEQ